MYTQTPGEIFIFKNKLVIFKSQPDFDSNITTFKLTLISKLLNCGDIVDLEL